MANGQKTNHIEDGSPVEDGDFSVVMLVFRQWYWYCVVWQCGVGRVVRRLSEVGGWYYGDLKPQRSLGLSKNG